MISKTLSLRDERLVARIRSEDSLLTATDYSHADQSAEIQALDVIEQRGEKQNPRLHRPQDPRREPPQVLRAIGDLSERPFILRLSKSEGLGRSGRNFFDQPTFRPS